MKRRTLNGIDEDDFIHPWDEEAMKVLRAVPGFEHMVKQLMQHGFEKILALQLTGMAVKAGPRQFAPLYERFVRDCEILDMPVPDLYIVNSPIPNAWTYGETQPLVGITSGLVALMDEDEVDFVIGHELGHIKCHHVLYRVVAENMKKILEIVGELTLNIGQVVGMGLSIPLYDWYRKAELSGDRAGLLVVQNEEVALRTMMKMAAGSREMADQMNLNAFMVQAREYEEADEELETFYKFLITAWRTHPMTVMRAKHIDEWIRTGGYSETLSGPRLLSPPDPDLEPHKTL